MRHIKLYENFLKENQDMDLNSFRKTIAERNWNGKTERFFSMFAIIEDSSFDDQYDSSNTGYWETSEVSLFDSKEEAIQHLRDILAQYSSEEYFQKNYGDSDDDLKNMLDVHMAIVSTNTNKVPRYEESEEGHIEPPLLQYNRDFKIHLEIYDKLYAPGNDLQKMLM